jgi:hypothetical protein
MDTDLPALIIRTKPSIATIGGVANVPKIAQPVIAGQPVDVVNLSRPLTVHDQPC